MSFGGDLAKAAVSAAVPALAELLYKLANGRAVSKDEVGQALARVAVDTGLEGADLARYVTDEGARRVEEADALMRRAVYGA